jgi:hypothetical protein
MLRACGEHVATNIQTSCCEHFFHVANNFSHVANTFSMLRPPPSSPDIVYILRVMLRVCGEHVASLWRACCDHRPNIRCKVGGQLEGRPIFSPRRTSDQEHYRYGKCCAEWISINTLLPIWTSYRVLDEGCVLEFVGKLNQSDSKSSFTPSYYKVTPCHF